jgi:hypothetical protein
MPLIEHILDIILIKLRVFTILVRVLMVWVYYLYIYPGTETVIVSTYKYYNDKHPRVQSILLRINLEHFQNKYT